MFHRAIVASIGMIAIVAFAAWFFFIRVTDTAVRSYQHALQQHAISHKRKTFSQAPMRQTRKNTRKELWTVKNGIRSPIALESESSYLVFSQKKDKINAIEYLQKLKCHTENPKSTSLADEGVFYFPEMRLVVERLRAETTQPALLNAPKIEYRNKQLTISKTFTLHHALGFLEGETAILRKINKQDGTRKKGKEFYCLAPKGKLEKQGGMFFSASTGHAFFNAKGKPDTCTLEQDVHLSSQFSGKESYAFAERALFFAKTKQCALYGSPTQQVLFWQEGLEMSAPSILVGDIVQGIGNVRFSFTTEEQSWFRQHIPIPFETCPKGTERMSAK